MKKQICKRCKLFVEAQQCPVCKDSNFANGWQGRIMVLNGTKSFIAKQVNMTHNGEYAIKVK
ncbi:DNA-directed RNA polymerase subunit E'' [Candidatus Woesearchaeota archaeon]|nr:DNA-directed RNA polymerase subunit E'' [Candidatus Woesearchaeota archaeon]